MCVRKDKGRRKNMGKTDLDDHGQPLNKRFNVRRMAERAIDEMLGICKGILADGVVVPMEVEYLKDWLWSNKETAGMWPANVLAERLRRIFADGHVDSEEREDLQELLESVTGLRDETTIGERKSTQLPLDDPMPDLDFEGRLFCFTGKFAYGTRNDCQYAVVQLGGQCQSNPTKKTDYLVIGIFGSNEWIHTTHGRKIEAVIQNRHKGALTAIIDEDHWVKNLP